jgi:hypothetical protein
MAFIKKPSFETVDPHLTRRQIKEQGYRGSINR